MNILEFIKKIKFQTVFGLIIYATCFCYLWWLSSMAFKHSDTPKDISEIKMAVISLVSIIVGFFFGSSSGSKAKDEASKDKPTTSS